MTKKKLQAPQRSEQTEKKSRRRKLFSKKLFWKIFRSLMILGFCCAGIFFLIIAYYAKDLPDLDEFATTTVKPVIIISDERGAILAKYGDVRGNTLTYNQIPITLIEALTAIEDRRFFEHFGLDVFGILRAYIVNIKAGRVVQGGSTITQQLAKIAYLNPERTFKRKIQELLIALQLEHKFSKEQIISMYFNKVYLGRGLYGIDAASQFYFSKEPGDITLFESAMLAGMIQAPSRFSPAVNPSKAVVRARVVLKRMVDENFITPEEAKKAVPPIIAQHGVARGELKNPYFADYVLNEIHEIAENLHQDLNVVTTLDINLQNKLEAAIHKRMEEATPKYGVSQSAALSIEPNGAIKAMVGGLDYKKSSFNRAVSAKRQSGSAFKFFVYAAAMEAGYTPDYVLVDQPLKIFQGKGLPLWSPNNFDKTFQGEMTLEYAFSKSINTIAVQLCEEVGRKNVIAIARDMGIKGDIPDFPSIALGVTDVSLMEMTQSFAVIPNEGEYVKPFAVLSISLKDGTLIYQHPNLQFAKLLPTDALEKMKVLLHSVVTDGTGKGSNVNGLFSYGKTGTTQDHKDAWFIGFTDDLVTGIWVGNDNNVPMKNLVGGSVPTWIWRDYMSSFASYSHTNLSEADNSTGGVFDVVSYDYDD